MVDDDTPEADPLAGWSDAEFMRAVALAVFTAEIEEEDGDARSPDYDW